MSRPAEKSAAPRVHAHVREASVAGDQLRNIVERIERLTEERKSIADDIAEIYRESKANGFDNAAIKAVVKARALPAAERYERDAIFDLYWQAIHGGSSDGR